MAEVNFFGTLMDEKQMNELLYEEVIIFAGLILLGFIVHRCHEGNKSVKDFLFPSWIEVFGNVVGWCLKHVLLAHYHGRKHNFSVIHLTIAASKIIKSAAKDERDCSSLVQFILAIVLQLFCLLCCQLLSNNGFFGGLCKEFSAFKMNDGSYNPWPLMIVEVIFAIIGIAIALEHYDNKNKPLLPQP